MKKVLIFISLSVYLALSTGIVVNMHYCMDQLASTHFYGGKSEICGQCGMETDESTGCCRDEVKVVKLQEDQQSVMIAIFDFQLPFVPAPTIQESISFFIPEDSDKAPANIHAPPLISEQDTYLRNCVFRI